MAFKGSSRPISSALGARKSSTGSSFEMMPHSTSRCWRISEAQSL